MTVILGTAELAKALGVSRNMIALYRRSGKITPNADGRFDLEKVKAELAVKLRPRPSHIQSIGDREAARRAEDAGVPNASPDAVSDGPAAGTPAGTASALAGNGPGSRAGAIPTATLFAAATAAPQVGPGGGAIKNFRQVPDDRFQELMAGDLPRNISEAELVHEIEKIKKARIANLKEEGDLIAADDARQAWAGMLSAIRSSLLLFPAKVAEQVAAVPDTAGCQVILDREIRRLLAGLSEYEPGKLPHAA